MDSQLAQRILGVAVEIQDQIFGFCLLRQNFWDTSESAVPNLLIACRGEADLYQLMLKIYYTVNSFGIDHHSIRVVNALNPETARLLVHLHMQLFSYSLDETYFEDLFLNHSRLNTAQNVEILRIYTALSDDYPFPLIKGCLERFPKLRTLKIYFTIHDYCNLADYAPCLESLSSSLEPYIIGKPEARRVTTTYSRGDQDDFLIWTWEVTRGFSIHRSRHIAEEEYMAVALQSLDEEV